MAACSSAYYEYYVKDLGAGFYQYYQWSKGFKTVAKITRSTIPGADYFPLENGAIVDVREYNSRVQLVVIDYTSPSTDYLRYIDLSSTSGDTRNKLLLKTNNTGTNNVDIRMYALGLQEITNVSFALQTVYTAPIAGYPSDGYLYPEGTFTGHNPCMTSETKSFVIYTCDGYTRNTVTGSAGAIVTGVELNSPMCGYAAPVTGGYDITERKTFKIEQCIPANPVYLCWLNTLGAWEQYLFGVTQTYELDVTSDGSYQENFNSIADTTNPDKVLKKRAQERMRLGASGLTHNQKDAVKELLYSPAVYILNSSLEIQMAVNPIPATFQTKRTSVELTDIEFEILLPEIITIGN